MFFQMDRLMDLQTDLGLNNLMTDSLRNHNSDFFKKDEYMIGKEHLN